MTVAAVSLSCLSLHLEYPVSTMSRSIVADIELKADDNVLIEALNIPAMKRPGIP